MLLQIGIASSRLTEGARRANNPSYSESTSRMCGTERGRSRTDPGETSSALQKRPGRRPLSRDGYLGDTRHPTRGRLVRGYRCCDPCLVVVSSQDSEWFSHL